MMTMAALVQKTKVEALPKKKATMKRLKGFDYSKPYFYMVTIKRKKGLAAFSEIVIGGRAIDNTLMGGGVVNESFVETAPSVSKPAPIFDPDWHDWIVKKDGQLAAFTRYIRENPERAWLRKAHPEYFGRVSKVSFLGREWFAYGNLAILELPVLKAVKGHRATKPGSAEWNALVEDCSRIGPGGAGVGTFMSPLEKECGNAIAATGGKWVVLSPEGFHERWHPGRRYEKFCAEGRMLFLSLYAALDHLPTKSELYHRCHEMGDIIVAGLSAR